MTKQRLMLSAAMAALLMGAYGAARADTTVSNDRKTAIDTASSGNITIDNGAEVELKTSAAAVTINSSNSVTNAGTISNTKTGGATGLLIDTTNGNLVTSTGFANYGGIDLSGDGNNKAAIAIIGPNTFFGPITMSELTSGVTGNSTTSDISSVTVKGDGSYILYEAQTATIDGDVALGGSYKMSAASDSNATEAPMFDFEGAIEGNLTFDNQTTASSIGNGARGVVILGPITPCQSNSGLGYTCANTTNEVGAFVNSGTIAVAGVGPAGINNNHRNNYPESGSAVVIANSIAGGFLNNGPSTGSANTVVGILSANGAVVGGVPYPTLLIDPSQSITSTQATIRGPVTLGIIPVSIDPIDGASGSTGPGYSVINHGSILAQPIDQNTSAIAVSIQGASPIDYTCLGVYTGGACSPNYAANGGGFLNTGTISAQAVTSVNSNSTTDATAVTIGAFATVPRFVVSGEPTSSTTYTAGTVAASVSGPGGGSAVAMNIGNLASVPEIDVLSHGAITATVTTTTVSPGSTIATTASPFIESSVAIVDASGSVKTINNAGTIAASVTQLTPSSNAVTQVTTHAIDLQAGTHSNTASGTVINNSGVISGDIYFNAGGGQNVLNVGNTGSSSILDTSGASNQAIAAVQGSAVTNSPNNYAIISERIDSQTAGQPPLTDAATIDFGAGTGNQLHVGGFGYVNATIISANGGLAVDVDDNGILYVARPTNGSVNVSTLNVNDGGTLGLTIAQNTSTTPVIVATGASTIDANANIGLQFGTFISSGTTAASTAHPTPQVITLISGPVTDNGVNSQNTQLAQDIPFLFESPTEAGYSGGPLLQNPAGSLTLTLIPRSTGKTNADGTAGLNLSGAALKLFPYTASALGNDPTLGAAIASNLTVYNNSTGAPSGINIAASQKKAQQVFSQFAPDASGATRAVAVMITDQATGPVAARQRLLRYYGDKQGDMTLWGEEYFGMVNNKGRFDGEGDLTNYKDHGFGFTVGMDGGAPRLGWYGGALTFYASDAIETLPRASKTNMQWFMATGYTDWRGKHVFLDTTGSLAYGGFKGRRDIAIGDQSREAVGRRSGELLSLGATTGVFLKYGSLDVVPHISLDGMTMREGGYTETGGGSGFDLQVAPYYASSLRAFLGADVKESVNIFGATVSPEARLGYRYDFIGSPVKLKAAFASTGGLDSPGNSFSFKGPDPDTGDAVVGLSLGAGTGDWQLGVNYDWIRGNNASTTQVGTFTLLGRI